MSNNNNIIALSDASLIAMLGAFVKHHRLQQNKTQFQLATEAGLNRTTLAEFENGKKTNLNTFVQLLRALNLLYVLEPFKVEFTLSPIQLAKLEQKTRKRASRQQNLVKKIKSSW